MMSRSDPRELLGRFQIERELSRGGAGVVYAAFDRTTNRRVALKRLIRGASPRLAALFEREFYVLSALRHPRIIEVYEYGVDGGVPFYTMELLEGSDLRELSPADVPAACRYLRDVASSLALLHARRLVHRDVSPRNVRTTRDGSCKLIDFGALAAFGMADDIVGTPPAMPPEALHGLPLDQRSDLFSLGALGYYLLTGRHAYPARSIGDLVRVWAESPPPPSAFAPVPFELDQLVLALLSLDVLSRPATAADVIDRLTVTGRLEAEHDVRTARAYLIGTSLVEREDALQRVVRRIAAAKERRGSSLFVEGDPGCGRTRFLAEIALKAQVSGVTVARADAAVHSGVLETARALTSQFIALAPEVATAALKPHVPLITRVWPELTAEGDEVPASPVSKDLQTRHEVLAALETAIMAVVGELPLVLAVDNVHRADPDSLALLISLSRRARGEQLLLVSTSLALSDDQLSHPVRALRDECSAIRLRALSQRGVEELVRSVFGEVPRVPRMASRLFSVTAGNPDHCMRLMDHWVSTDLIGYRDGVWALPIEVPDAALLRFEYVAVYRLDRCSREARALADVLAVHDAPATVDFATAILIDYPRGVVVTALDELAGQEILVRDGSEYEFRQETLQRAIFERIGAERKQMHHRKIADVLLRQTDDPDGDARFLAGLHLMRAGDETRGADLVAMTAREFVAKSDATAPLVRAVPALEGALDVYRRQSRTNLAFCDLVVPMAFAGYDVSFEFGIRYGDEAITRLRSALGLGTLDAPSRFETAEELRAVLSRAPVLELGEERTANTPDVVTLVGWLLRCAITLTAAASAAIDYVTEERAVAALEPFKLFDEHHPAAIAHEYCSCILAMSTDRLADAHRRWSALTARLEHMGLSPGYAKRLALGASASLGILETQRDDQSALPRIEELERSGDPRSMAIAHQLRCNFHGFRGEIHLAERARELLEALAIQRGVAWQVEIWSTSTLGAIYGNTRDAAGARRIVEQLERLKKSVPSLELYWERAVAAQRILGGDAEGALEIYEKLLACEPRVRVGWSSVRGGAALALNECGRHEEARVLSEETIRLSEEDRDYVAMNLKVRLQRCLAYAGLGAFEVAKAKLEELFSTYQHNENPMTLGSLHRTGAEIALQEGNGASLESHVTEMERWFRSTRNPSLIAQCEALRRAFAKRSRDFQSARVKKAALSVTASMTLAASVLANCRGSDERKRRALELLAEKAGAEQAWLFGLREAAEPVLVTSLAPSDVPGELAEAVRELCTQHTMNAAEETACLDTGESLTPGLEPSVSEYRLFPLTVQRGGERLLVGVAATPAGSSPALVSSGLVDEIANQLFQAGDVTAVHYAQ